MPDMVPVATQIQPPDPSKGLGLLSSIIGIRQQQQALQTGQALQQTAQANAQQDQQKNQELQAVSGLMKNVHNGGYRNEDGSFNRQKFADDVSSVAPTYGQDIATSALAQANEVVQNQKAKQDLTDSARSSLGDTLTALAKDPNTRRDDVITAYQNWLQNHKDDPAAFRVGLAQATLLPQNDSDPNFRATLGKYAATLTGKATTAPSSVDTGAAIQPGVTSNISGAFTPSGQSIRKEIAPQLVSPPGGVPVAYPGGRGPVPQTVPGPAPTSQDWQNFGAYQANLNNRVGVASDALPRIQAAEEALDQVRGGANVAARSQLAKELQAIGLPQNFVDAVAGGNLGAAQEAEKYLFQTTFAGLKQSMQGDPTRVSEFQAAEQVFPSLGTDPRATKSVLKFMQDQGNRDFAEQQALNKSRTQGTFNPVTWQADYQSQLRAGKVPGVPSSQVPGGVKAMPSAARLQAYADKYTGGDLGKARTALRDHGYQ